MDRPGRRLTVTDRGSGRTVVVLHGGGGPQSVATIVEHYAARNRVIAPTLPGWNGTPRPAWLDTVDDIAIAAPRGGRLQLPRRRRVLRRPGLLPNSRFGSSIGPATCRTSSART